MAHSARLLRLIDDLTHSVTGLDPKSDRQTYKRARDIANKGLRGQQHARINPFHVTATFAGLDEKFRVKNRDDLADALQERLLQLSQTSNKLIPDVLSLLLQLSDRPLENTRIETLALLRPDSPIPPRTWTDILQEDPYSDEEIWKDIDYAAESSDDGTTSVKLIKREPEFVLIDSERPVDLKPYVVQTSPSLTDVFKITQFGSVLSNDEGAKTGMSELRVIRETLFMLSGASTSLYILDKQQDDIRLNPAYVLSRTTPSTSNHLLAEFTAIGRDLLRLRQWTDRRSSQPMLQRLKSAIKSRLTGFQRSLSGLHDHHIKSSKPVTVSVLDLMHQIRASSMPLVRLAHLVSDGDSEPLSNPVKYLEVLFDQVTLAQATLNEDMYGFMSEIFFECLQTYLNPIRRWMESGELSTDVDTFFILESNARRDPSRLWHSHFTLRCDTQGNLQAPAFLHHAAGRIFNTGKSLLVLQELGIKCYQKITNSDDSRLDLSCVQFASDMASLSPFVENLRLAFQNWISSKFSLATNVLRTQILDAYGLMRVLRGFETLYLSRNGAVFENFAVELFERLDSQRTGWNDRYVLTETARTIFTSAMTFSDANKISVHTNTAKRMAPISMSILSIISVDFALPWLLQNIIRRSTISVYQQAFTFIIQTVRAKYLLQSLRPCRLRTIRHPTEKGRLISKIRHNLTFFVDTLRMYLLSTAVFSTSHGMYTAMGHAQDVDEMVACHTQFIQRLQERMLLSDTCKVVKQATIEVLDLCVSFSTALNLPSYEPRKNIAKLSTSESIESDGRTTDRRARQDRFDGSSKDEAEDSCTTPFAGRREDPTMDLRAIDAEFDQLRMFICTGLRSMARAGGEPMWEQLVERLQWESKKTSIILD